MSACEDAKVADSEDATCDTGEMHGHLKRQLSNAENVPFAKKKRMTQGSVVPQNAIIQLYDIKRWVQFQFVSQTERAFTMSVEVNGQTFIGKGPSKKKAKLNAAEQAVKSFVHLPNIEEADQVEGRQIQNMDFTTESGGDVLFSNLQKSPDEENLNVKGSLTLSPDGSNLPPVCMSKVPKLPDCKHQVVILKELRPGLKNEFMSEICENPISHDPKVAKSVRAECEMQGFCKRQISDAENVLFSKEKRTTNRSTVPQNALMRLYDIQRSVRFQLVSRTEPTFTMSVEVNGQTFVGKGPSKKKAKVDAAEQAVRSYVQLPNAEEAHQAMDRQIMNVDFTGDLAEAGADMLSNNHQKSPNEETLNVRGSLTLGPNGSNLSPGRMSNVPKQPDCKIPVMILNELRPDLKNEFVSEIRESLISHSLSGSISGCEGLQPKLNEGASEVPKVLADLVSRLVNEKLFSLTDGFKNPYAVLEGIMTRGYDVDDTSHICVSTDVKVAKPEGAEGIKGEMQEQL